MRSDTAITVTAVLGDGLNHMAGISGLASITIGDSRYLYATSAADGGLTAWRLDGGAAGGVAVLVDQLGYTDNRGTRGAAGLTLTRLDDQPLLLPAGRWDDRLSLHQLGADGSFDRVQILGADPDKIGGLAMTLVVPTGDTTWILASQWGRDGVQVTQLRGDLSLNPLGPVTQAGTADLSGISAMASLQIGDTAFVFAASASGDSVSSFVLDAQGGLRVADTQGARTGVAMDAPTVMAAVHIADKDVLVVGAAGTGTIDTFKVTGSGGLKPLTQVMDDRETRFDDISAMDILETEGRFFAIAGGSDDGITVFELTSQGEMFHVTTLAQPLGTTLADITAIEAVRNGDRIDIFVSGEDLPGVTQLAMDVTNLGPAIYGTPRVDRLKGIRFDEILIGMGSRDEIDGGRGDDVIVDGLGRDRVRGGEGADVFCFIPDQTPDFITDFEPGIDRIDLSAFPMLYSIDQLDIVQKRGGVKIAFAGDPIRVEMKDDLLLIDDLGPDDFLF